MRRGLKGKLSLFIAMVFLLNLLVPVFALDLERYGSFPDVASNHWAKQVITKMNLRNVVSGYNEYGVRSFKPDQSVTQGEAVLMALRTMGLQNKEAQVDTSRYLPFNVPSWAKAAALVAVDEGLIVGNQFDWDAKAGRAWVSQLLVRMLDKEDEINEVSEEFLPFNDTLNIPIQYLNYVKVAYRYGLLKGDDKNNFEPNNSVTRAQMVAFLSRAEEYLDIHANDVIIGKISSINNTNVTVLSDTGDEYTLVCDIIKTNLYGSGSEEIWLSDLQVNDRVYIIVEGNIIKYLDLNAPQTTTPPKAINSSGTILQVYPEENTVVIKNKEGKLSTLSLNSNTKIVRESDGTAITIDKLAKNQEVSFNMDSNGKLLKITVLSGMVSSDGQGVVYSVEKDLQLITLKNINGLAAYLYNEDTQVIINNNRFATVGDIKIGDSIQVELEDGLITKINLIASEVDLASAGIVKQISTDSRILTYQTPDNQLKAHFVENNASIDFNGQVGTLAEVLVGDAIEVKIENGKITNLSVTNRKLHERSKGIVVSTDYTNRILTIRDSLGQLNAYELLSSAEILINNKSSYLHEVKKDMQVEIELSDSKISYLAARDTLLGTVVRASNSTKVIELALETGETKSYSVHTGVNIVMEDITRPDLDDIKKGDVVEVRVENSKVTEIKVQRNITYKITETFSGSSRVKVVDDDNNSRYLYIYSDVELDINGKSNAKVSDLKVNDVVKATFLGYKLQKVEMAPVVIGTVSAVNSASGSITINTYDGRTFTYQFDGSSRVVKNNQAYYNLGIVVVGDRVAVEESLGGGKVYSLMNKVSGKVGALYKDKTRIYLQITQTNWQQYEMLTGAYLHQGVVELTPSDFKLNDNVDIYLVNNKVYEVVKK
ncbi:MAG: S-layer homology domain-containing protein [Peptococcales bacterium]|jgi:hypothetical protein